MRSLILVSVVCLQLGWSHGEPKGVGAYAYQDTSGNSASDRRASFRKARALDPLTTPKHLRPTRFAPFPPLPPLQPFPPLPPLQPLRPLQPLLPFPSLPPLPPLQPFQPLPPLRPLKPLGITDRFDNFGGFAGFPGFGFSGPDMNSAFASGVAGPGFTHQIAAINPQNPKQGNVNVMNRFADTDNPAGFYSVQTSSFSSSSDIGGKKVNHRRAETVVNKDGKVTAYKVEN